MREGELVRCGLCGRAPFVNLLVHLSLSLSWRSSWLQVTFLLYGLRFSRLPKLSPSTSLIDEGLSLSLQGLSLSQQSFLLANSLCSPPDVILPSNEQDLHSTRILGFWPGGWQRGFGKEKEKNVQTLNLNPLHLYIHFVPSRIPPIISE